MLNRRNFLTVSSSIAMAGALPRFAYAQNGGRPDHLFLTFLFDGGVDPTYLFDARPLSMSSPEDGVLQNYIGEEPYLWNDNGPYKTFASALTKPLEKYRDRLTILNGVQMATSFDGHDQNTNFFLTGNPFGGESFIPHIAARAAPRRPLDYIQTGFVFAEVSNSSASITLDAESASQLSGVTSLLSGISADHPNMLYAKSIGRRAHLNRGMFANAATKMNASLDQVPNLVEQLSELEINAGEDELLSNLDMITNFFRKGLTNQALLTQGSFGFDTHDSQSAQDQPNQYSNLVENISKTIEFLLNTPYDEKTSMYEHTTFIITSEFGRTMRQMGLPLDATGTDHNPLTNSFILGGAGIQGGKVFGASDFRSKDDPLDGAHLSLDPNKVKMMGRPFDFENSHAISDPLNEYSASNYLTCNSVVNSIYEFFGNDSSQYRLTERNGGVAPIIKGLFV